MQVVSGRVEDSAARTERFIDVGDVRLHVVEAGPEKGELVILLHGFPEFWWSWRLQIPALANAGFRVVAPDMRGYGQSDKPYAVDAYGVGRLVGDVAALVRAYGRERAHIVGHDWGGAIAWEFAMRRPEMVGRLAILNAPHPRDILRGLRRPAQMRRSWYIFFFQIPGLPEKLMAKDDYAFVRNVFRALPRADVEKYVEAAKRARGLNGPINYYRAMIRGVVRGRAPTYRPVVAPTLVVWGERDATLGKELARPDARWVPNARVEMLPDASHWVQLDAPERVNRLLVEHLTFS